MHHFPIVDTENCLCVVVTYHPDDALYTRLKQLQDVFQHILVVDNSHIDIYVSKVARYVNDLELVCINNASNLGLGRALNQGFEFANAHGFEWCVFFDQDTSVSSNFLSSLQECATDLNDSAAFFGSNYSDMHAHKVRFETSSELGVRYRKVRTVITSGSLISMAVYNMIGGFREDYFIDSIDHEYCLRARKQGFEVFLSLAVGMDHSLGDERRSLKVFSSFPEHNPIRKFYIARNSMVTVITYFSFDKIWCLKQIVRILLEVFCVILFESRKVDKLMGTIKGLIAGARGRFDAD